jgi:hypothetical protein
MLRDHTSTLRVFKEDQSVEPAGRPATVEATYEEGRITSISIPGCTSYTFTYTSDVDATNEVDSVDVPDECVPAYEAIVVNTPSPTRVPS